MSMCGFKDVGNPGPYLCGISNLYISNVTQVWDALKILDAADIDKPGASSGIVEIYSLRVVPKWLSGKPQGWNRDVLRVCCVSDLSAIMYKESDLNMGENSCIDRCVSKYWNVTNLIGQLLGSGRPPM
ncbi:mitochondrial import inner membrane translocase subunit TIM10-like protein [Trifolium pratense]|uniref:Mitochondrial import inner membrane translocase subunit n=1 Tax=Trifolium pratense TaxID=57577 RepID=A0A2K3ND51_TRIPR|nr:mitochondrial import inner membrane translocase subunit TIM10-like protein [Trifolium pratense]